MIHIALSWSEALFDLHHLTDIILLQMRHLGRIQLQINWCFIIGFFDGFHQPHLLALQGSHSGLITPQHDKNRH